MSKILVDMEKAKSLNEETTRLSQDATISDETVSDPEANEKTDAADESRDAVAQEGSATALETTPTDEEWEYITGYKLSAVLGIVTLACFTMLLDTSIIVTAIPRITSDFHSLGDVGWYGSAYLLSRYAYSFFTFRFFC